MYWLYSIHYYTQVPCLGTYCRLDWRGADLVSRPNEGETGEHEVRRKVAGETYFKMYNGNSNPNMT